MRLKGMAGVLNHAARTRLCESSGSEHYSPEDSDDLSDLVNSFIESGDFTNTIIPAAGGGGGGLISNCGHQENKSAGLHEESASYSWSDSDENNNILKDLLSSNNEHDDDPAVRRIIREQTKLVCDQIIILGEKSSSQLYGGCFKRTLMSHLRGRGFDAGLCKSRWGKFGKQPPGEYEYVDVNVDGNRFIIEVNLATEFEIARPSTAYATLLNYFPKVYIGKAENVKQIVRLMCSAARVSMKEMKLHVPPWRRNGYMQAKWFGPYKRTINEIPSSAANNSKNKPFSDDESFAAGKRSIGFEAFPANKGYNICRGNYLNISKVGLKVGYLTSALNANPVELKL